MHSLAQRKRAVFYFFSFFFFYFVIELFLLQFAGTFAKCNAIVWRMKLVGKQWFLRRGFELIWEFGRR